MEGSKNILITGASGLIGTRLTYLLISKGHNVSHLSRSKKPGRIPVFTWDMKAWKIDPEAFTSAHAIIHLAGAGVADERWTSKRKKEILESRTLSTRLLFDHLKQNRGRVESIVSASAIGFYGFDREDWLRESSPPGNDFLAEVTRRWEQEVDEFDALGIRVVKLRIGIVLSNEGGALKEMATPVRFFVGAPLGSGNQMISWIHIDDLCAMFIHAVEDPSMRGAYNAVAPNPVSNSELTKQIAQALNRPLFLPRIPEAALRLLLGEMSSMVVKGSKISANKIIRQGFNFTFPDLKDAIADLLVKK